MKIDIETLKKTKGIGSKTLERIIEQHEMDNDIKSFESVYVPSEDYKVDKDINLWQGDCLELMSHIPDRSVDMILCDLPYGTTACSWDEIIPFEPLWKHYKRIIKDNGAIVLFGSEPFSTKLRMSNLDWYRYDWIWIKHKPSNFALSQKQPMKYHENISIFYKKHPIYNPQMQKRTSGRVKQGQKTQYIGVSKNYGELNSLKTQERAYDKYDANFKLPSMHIEIPAVQSNSKEKVPHPTQKPVKLLEYLIKTYTNEEMTVLDNTMGSGSTGVACKNLNRKFIGIELDEEYFNIAEKRINE